jgi:hypothetical protein
MLAKKKSRNSACTTKQPRPASRPRVSKWCRWLLLLGLIKLSILFGMIIMPDLARQDANAASPAQAANPFATSPPPPVAPHPPVRDDGGVPAFGLRPAREDGPLVPVVRPNQGSPFAQPVPEYSRPDEVNDIQPPAPTVSPMVPRDSTAHQRDALNRRERELLALQEQMKSRIEELRKIEGNVQNMIQQADTSQDDKIRHLIDVYANMKARQAAAVLTTLDERIAVKILAGMRGRQAGEILTYMNADRAARLSEALSRTQLQ